MVCITIKSMEKKWVCLLEVIGRIFFVLLIQNIELPKGDNTTIGICNEDGKYVENLFRKFEQQDSLFDFKVYQDRESMEEDVISGIVECGFVFEKDFATDWQEDNYKDTITYICTPLTTKGYVAQETVFAVILREFSSDILQQSASEIYSEPDTQTIQELQEKNEEYLSGSSIFRVDTKTVEQKEQTEKKSETYPIQGMVGLLIFISMLINGVSGFNTKGHSIINSLDKENSRMFLYTGNLARATMQTVTGFILIMTVNNRGIFIEFVTIILFVLLSALWVLIFGRLFRKEITYVSLVVTLIILNLIICPVFIDLSIYVPALQYISYCFPLGIYLGL